MLWAITSHFNPCGFRQRVLNYFRFRESLPLPLLTVELSFDGKFELSESDANRVVQLHGGDILWQKERLLNIAAAHLPRDCRKVLWIDGDVVFPDPEWRDKTEAALDRFALIQPYSWVHMLPRETLPETLETADTSRLQSFVSYCRQHAEETIPSQRDCRLANYSPGMAWGIDREIISACGLYDAMTLGSADILMGQAAFGRARDVLANYDLAAEHQTHFLDWSARYHHAVGGSIGFVDSPACHLWHGELIHRQYLSRYENFSRFEFDPVRDLRRDPVSDCWRWNSPKPELHQRVRDYFINRREDG